MENKIFSERLKLVIEQKRIIQTELAKQIGITETSLSRYVNGQRIPNCIIVAKLAETLNVTTDYLLGLNDDFNSSELGKIDIKNFLEFCNKAADGWNDFKMKALDNIGHGDGVGSSFGAVAYGDKMETMYRYEIPNVLNILGKNADKN